MQTNTLQIKLFEYCAPNAKTSEMMFSRHADFLVDGEPLSKALGILDGRPHCGSTMLDTIPPPSDVVKKFLARPSRNEDAQKQASPERFTLYSCDCGGEDCGSITCLLERQDDLIYWKDIRSEGLASAVVYPDLVFNFDAYQDELEDYIDRNPTT